MGWVGRTGGDWRALGCRCRRARTVRASRDTPRTSRHPGLLARPARRASFRRRAGAFDDAEEALGRRRGAAPAAGRARASAITCKVKYTVMPESRNPATRPSGHF